MRRRARAVGRHRGDAARWRDRANARVLRDAARGLPSPRHRAGAGRSGTGPDPPPARRSGRDRSSRRCRAAARPAARCAIRW
ncbi:MAG: hypothetical protein FJ385_04350 [Verrucomicrobia bacterium]|nr:hypothetical protein [Verrucomicrobiota bacterium]